MYTDYITLTTKVLDSNSSFPTGINWLPSYYYFGLPQQTIDNNPKLAQTIDWPGGTFDPKL